MLPYNYYTVQLRVARGTGRSKSYLWPDGIVPYTFHESISSNKEATILSAMDFIANNTCLQFVPYTEERDYVTFRNKEGAGCSSFVGKTTRAGQQFINLGTGCGYKQALHEICHALGMWHEQSRPDRDNYVRVLTDNIKDKYLFAFQKRNAFSIDSLGTPYDYASRMHYGLGYFRKEKGLQTLEIINLEWYKEQGSPKIAGANTLSKLDIIQLNRLYNCPGSGNYGELRVHIEQAENLGTSSGVYVEVTAVDDNKMREVKSTHYVEGTANPNWDEWLEFGGRAWQYIEVSIVQVTGGQVTNKQSFSVNPGHHSHKHCNNQRCNKNLTFSIDLDNECPCQNRGSCVNTSDCSCSPNFNGPLCEYPRGQLYIYAHYGGNLPDKDTVTMSDVYLEVKAYDHLGNNKTLETKIIKDSLSPAWDEVLDFGVRDWSWFTVQAWDHDPKSADDELSNAQMYSLTSHTPLVKERMNGTEGYIYFDYSFE